MEYFQEAGIFYPVFALDKEYLTSILIHVSLIPLMHGVSFNGPL